MTDNKKNRLTWAYAELNEAINRDFHGSISFNFQGGIIVNAKIDECRKPAIDKVSN